MLPRFVVVPAIPREAEAMRLGGRYYCKTDSTGFDIYDNEEKQRLKKSHPSREEAENECRFLNL
ncbi:MAG: hypothetical protein ABIO21_14680 [Pseudomonas sp.]